MNKIAKRVQKKAKSIYRCLSHNIIYYADDVELAEWEDDVAWLLNNFRIDAKKYDIEKAKSMTTAM